MSPIFPIGRRNIAVDRRYEMATQLKRMASSWNSLPIDGRAILTDEPIKGVRNEPNAEASKAAFFPVSFSVSGLSAMSDEICISMSF